MTKSLKINKILGKNLIFVEIDNSDYLSIKRIREPGEVKGFLRKMDFSSDQFRDYITTLRNDQNVLYLKILDINKIFIGTVKIQRKSLTEFEWGSWVLAPKTEFTHSIESALIVYKFAIEYLDFSKCNFEVIKNNSNVVNFHTRLGARVIDEDNYKLYFELNLSEMKQLIEKYKRFLEKIIVL